MSIRAKTILLLFLTAMIPFIIIATISYVSAKNALEDKIGQVLLSGSNAAISQLGVFFENAVIDFSAWNAAPVMQDVLTDDEDEEIDNTLARLKSQYNHFSGFLVTNDQGLVVAATNEAHKKMNLSELPSVKAALGAQSFQGNVGTSDLVEAKTLVLALPIRAGYDSETIIGAFVGFIDWSSVQSIMAQITVSGLPQDGSHYLFLRSNGGMEVLFQSSEAPEGAIEYPIIEGTQNFQQGKQDLLIGTYLSKASGKFVDPGWIMHAVVTSEIAYQSVYELRNQLLLIAVILTVIIAAIGLYFSNMIVSPIKSTVDMVRDIAEGEGNLRQRLVDKGKDELDELASWFNKFMENLQQIIGDFQTSSVALASSAKKLSDNAQEAGISVDVQLAQTTEVASAVHEMSYTIQEVSGNSKAAAVAASAALSDAQQGASVISRSVTSIENLFGEIKQASEVIAHLKQQATDIGGVLDVIKGIADQTNLLALNAAIEAARAGEQGRGFAVVADEVRTLASRTQESTEEINRMIEALQKVTDDAVKVMVGSQETAKSSVEQINEANLVFNAIYENVTNIDEIMKQIATATEQQSLAAEEINQSITIINDRGSSTAEGARESATASNELAQIANNMQKMTQRFKV